MPVTTGGVRHRPPCHPQRPPRNDDESVPDSKVRLVVLGRRSVRPPPLKVTTVFVTRRRRRCANAPTQCQPWSPPFTQVTGERRVGGDGNHVNISVAKRCGHCHPTETGRSRSGRLIDGLNTGDDNSVFSAVRRFPKFLILNGAEDIRLVEIGADGDSFNSTFLVEHLEACVAMDVSVAEGLVFYADSREQLIMVHANRTQEHTVLESRANPSAGSIAVEWVSRKLYWHDTETNRIEVLSYERQPFLRKVIIYSNLDGVHGLVVDPLHSLLFFDNFVSEPAIERAWLDGTHREVIVGRDLSLPYGLAVDFQYSKIFWVDSELREIFSADLDGNDRQRIVSQLPGPLALALHTDFIYWSDYSAGILCCRKFNCSSRLQMNENLRPYVLRVYEKTAQPQRENPCEHNAECSHLCLLVPVPPFYTCTCPTGVKLLSDNQSCAEGPEEILLVARRSDLRVISLDTPDYTDNILNVKNIKHAMDVDYDPLEGYVYWSDSELKMIRRVKLDGTDESDVVISEFEESDGIALDLVARNIYWTDAGMKRIEVASLNGHARRILISTGLMHPRAIAIDPAGGYMFWTDWDEHLPKIESAYMDGSQRKTLIMFEPKHWPNGLALDTEAGRIYWAEASFDVIGTARMIDGSDRRVVLNKNLGHMYGFSLLGDYIYWSDWERRSLSRANKHDGSDRIVLHENIPDLMGVRAVYPKRMPNVTNACAVNNGGCSHLCLYRPIGLVCMCPVGWELDANGTTCIIPEAFLMFTQRDIRDVLRVSLASFRTNVDSLRLHNISQPLALDFHFKTNRIYWTGSEGTTGTICRAYLNGTGLETIVTAGLEYMEGIAIDWLAENLYWSDSGHLHIEMSRLDGKSRRIIVWKNTNPRALVVHPVEGYLYWADWLDPPSLQRSELDGRNRITLLKDVGRIFALTLDNTEKRLYWSEVDAPSIQSVDLNGGSRRFIVQEVNMKPTVLTEFGDYLYWANWRKQSIEISSKKEGQRKRTLHLDLHFIINLIAVHALKQRGWNQCATRKKECEHLCISMADRTPKTPYRCSCTSHYTLSSDKRSCTAPKKFVLFSQHSTVRRMKIKERQDMEEYPIVILPFEDQHQIRALQYDPLSRTLYWLSARTVASGGSRRVSYTVRRAKDNETKVEEIKLSHIDLEQAFDIALDPYSQTLFWSCEWTNSVNATRLLAGDVRPVGAVVSSPQYKPRSLAIYPKKRYLFFATYGTRKGIVLCLMDGSSCSFIVAEDVMQPEYLVYDVESNGLFWADPFYKRISRVDPRGRNRQDIVHSVERPFGLTVQDDKLYFVDSDVEKVEVVNKRTGAGRGSIFERLSGVSSILAVDIDEVTIAEIIRSPCLRRHCSHLCLLNIRKLALDDSAAECACPMDMALNAADHHSCFSKTTCKIWEWPCKDGLQCIDRLSVCDGRVDCDDGSDEGDDCLGCRPDEFECHQDRRCIHRLKHCDGKVDCKDGSDELCYCNDPANQFYCSGPGSDESAKMCIIRAWLCDGVKHCQDGTDEMFCGYVGGAGGNGDMYHRRIEQVVKPAMSTTTQDTVTYIIVAIIGVGLLAIVMLTAYFFCHRPNALGVQPMQIELVNRTTAENGVTQAVSTTVKYRYRLSLSDCRHSPGAVATRPAVAGKSSSSSSSDFGMKPFCRHRPPANPPPSPVSTVVSNSPGFIDVCVVHSSSNPRRTPHRERFRAGYGGGSYASHNQRIAGAPPPPYFSCSTDLNHTESEDAVADVPLLRQYDEPRPPPPSPTSYEAASSSNSLRRSDEHSEGMAGSASIY